MRYMSKSVIISLLSVSFYNLMNFAYARVNGVFRLNFELLCIFTGTQIRFAFFLFLLTKEKFIYLISFSCLRLY